MGYMCVLHDYVVNKQHLATCLFLQSPFLLFWVSWLSFVFSRFFEMLSFFLKILHKYKNNFGHVISPTIILPRKFPHTTSHYCCLMFFLNIFLYMKLALVGIPYNYIIHMLHELTLHEKHKRTKILQAKAKIYNRIYDPSPRITQQSDISPGKLYHEK